MEQVRKRKEELEKQQKKARIARQPPRRFVESSIGDLRAEYAARHSGSFMQLSRLHNTSEVGRACSEVRFLGPATPSENSQG